MPSNGELSILGLIKTILPDGTTRARSWDGICDWPPDLFAAVATITERSGLYAEPSFTAYWKKHQFALSPTWIRKTRARSARTGRNRGPRPKRSRSCGHSSFRSTEA